MKIRTLLALLILFVKISTAQTVFPQKEINDAFKNYSKPVRTGQLLQAKNFNPQSASSAYQMLNLGQQYNASGLKFQPQNNVMNADTLVVGDVPNDTVIITGLWTHTGPIWVLNDGVLIFYHATVIDTGDVYVFGHGQLLADSSSFFFPQQYFYQRSLLVVQNGFAFINNSSFNYSGYSHNLFLADSAYVVMNNIHQNDFTTCGLFGAPTLSINNCNLTGEYILTATCTAAFTNCDTLLLWHHFPDSAVINYEFPQGDTVYNYFMNNSVPGISGIGYTVFADTCHTVWWGMMPVNGSDVTISNSVLRTIGAWFQYGDTASITGLYDNSNYVNFTMPVADRNLHLINSYVQTWSLYVFDSSQINVTNSQVGEIGSQQHSTVHTQDIICDGSGGYFWATDTSFTIAANSTIYSTARSEKNGIFIFGYGWAPFAAPTAIGNSVMICVQNNLAADPIPYDGAIAWLENISLADTNSVDSIFPVTGSAWIDQGPLGSWMDFESYSLYYKEVSATSWTPIVLDSLNEVHTGNLATWNTYGLAVGNYLLRLLVHNDLGDSVEAVKAIVLLPNALGVIEKDEFNSVNVFPNPSNGKFQLEINSNKNSISEIKIQNILGDEIYSSNEKITTGMNRISIDEKLCSGIYIYKIQSRVSIKTGKFVIQTN